MAKKCRFCQRPFDAKFSSTQTVCSPGCGIALAQTTEAKKREKAYDKVTKERKEKLKTRGDYLKECQIAFNAFIRLRDKDEPCISCGNKNPVKQNAGHYRSVGSCIELRFCELNCFLQCEHCNSFLSGNLINYRKNLILRIGESKVEWLEGNHEMPKLTIEEIREKTKYYRQKVREIKNEQN